MPGFDEADRPALLAALEYQRASVRSIVDGLSEQDRHTSVVPSGWTPAGMVAHLSEETATHSGHLESARELLDGKTALGLR